MTFKTAGTNDQMRLDASGNLFITGALNPPSDRNAKRDFAPANSRAVLEKVVDLALSHWTYKGDEMGSRHLGPTAQDFRAAFGLGSDDKHIATVDADGVALAAIQGLHAMVKERDARIDKLEHTVAELRDLVDKMAQGIRE
jgi:hypothetical protein